MLPALPDANVFTEARELMLSHDAIAALIPHQGAMCLLDRVVSYDDQAITCVAVNHRDTSHPLREDGVLAAICGVEYAAQAMAVHGALMGGEGASRGVLAAVRDLTMNVDRLDDVSGELTINAQQLWRDETRLLYEFSIHATGGEIMHGRAAVVLSVAET
jgi:predicted hotdog family 3-hydroxylacyl-ACP dehydratase